MRRFVVVRNTRWSGKCTKPRKSTPDESVRMETFSARRTRHLDSLTAEVTACYDDGMDTLTFRIIIAPDERGTFHGYVPALPGCHTWGRTIIETRRRLRDAMRAYLKSLRADGLPIPRDHGFEMIETLTVRGAIFRRRSPTYA